MPDEKKPKDIESAEEYRQLMTELRQRLDDLQLEMAETTTVSADQLIQLRDKYRPSSGMSGARVLDYLGDLVGDRGWDIDQERPWAVLDTKTSKDRKLKDVVDEYRRTAERLKEFEDTTKLPYDVQRQVGADVVTGTSTVDPVTGKPLAGTEAGMPDFGAAGSQPESKGTVITNQQIRDRARMGLDMLDPNSLAGLAALGEETGDPMAYTNTPIVPWSRIEIGSQQYLDLLRQTKYQGRTVRVPKQGEVTIKPRKPTQQERTRYFTVNQALGYLHELTENEIRNLQQQLLPRFTAQGDVDPTEPLESQIRYGDSGDPLTQKAFRQLLSEAIAKDTPWTQIIEKDQTWFVPMLESIQRAKAEANKRERPPIRYTSADSIRADARSIARQVLGRTLSDDEVDGMIGWIHSLEAGVDTGASSYTPVDVAASIGERIRRDHAVEYGGMRATDAVQLFQALAQTSTGPATEIRE